MNELFTIILILAAIISFLNKIFGQKNKSESDNQNRPKKPPFEWELPWEIQEQEEDEEYGEQPIEEHAAEPVPEKIQPEFQKPFEKYDAKIYKSDLTDEDAILAPIEDTEIKAESFVVDLSSRENLREGIVLLEILGPCRAKKRFH